MLVDLDADETTYNDKKNFSSIHHGDLNVSLSSFFTSHQINLVKIKSVFVSLPSYFSPLPSLLNQDYCFSVDCDGRSIVRHIAEVLDDYVGSC